MAATESEPVVSKEAQEYIESSTSVPVQRCGQERHDDLDPEVWIEAVRTADGDLALCFQSGEGEHIVTKSRGVLIATYSGPHGVEARPTDIREEAIAELISTCPFELTTTENTALANSAVSDLI